MKIYFIGICGTAMGNVALMLRQMGHEVHGADSGIYPPMSDVLSASDIKLYEGYDPARLEIIDPDLVVVGNVVSRGHPEMEWLLETRRYKYTSLPALLHDLVLEERRNIVVAGTHGKTTTSTLTAWLLDQCDATPGYLIGGVPCDLPSGAEPGCKGGPFVIEGDEYDSAFFDKRSKFIHYLPNILIVNNLEFDHADIFRDLDDVKRTFSHAIRLVPRNGFILYNADDENLKSLLPVSWTETLAVGLSDDADLRIKDFSESADGSEFDLIWKGEHWAHVKWQQRGMYNARNAAMASLAAGLMLSPKDLLSFDLSALESFSGVKRRQELLYEDESLLVFEDFGHHPSAIRDTLASLRQCYPDACITACFEPRSNTARTRVFQEALPDAFVHADNVMLGAIHRAESLSAEDRLDPVEIVASIRELNPDICVEVFEDNNKLLTAALEKIDKQSERQSLYCFFSNGSFDGIMKRFVEVATG